MGNVAGYIIAVLLGAALASGAYWKYSGPPSTELRWSNYTEVMPEPSQTFSELHAKDAWVNPTVSVYSAPYTAPHAAPVTLKDLSTEGQTHAIDFILKQRMPSEVARQKLMSLFGDDTGARDRGDPYRVDRVLIATVAKGLNTLPGDRLMWTRIFVEPINFKFAGYTVATTENKSIKLASIENSTSAKLSIRDGSDTDVPGLGKPEVGQEVEKTQKASSDVNEQYENLGVDIQPNFLRIIRESARGGDVAGNTTIQLSMLTDPSIIWCETAKEERCPAKVLPTANDDDGNLELVVSSAHLADGEPDPRIDVLPQSVLPHCSLKAKVGMLYELRTIKNGRRNLLEGLQEVELRQDESSARTVGIVPADDVSPAVWSIKVTDAKAKQPVTDNEPDLFAQIDKGSARKLVFTDYLTASELAHWLKKQMAAGTRVEPRLKKMTFHVNGVSATKPHPERGDTIGNSNKVLIPFKHVRDDCEPDRNMTASK
jgi:hypothetical protein